MELIDLSLTISLNESEPVPIRIDYISHEEGASMLGSSMGLTKENFPDNKGLSTENVFLTTHTGTHIDAPLHYGPECEGASSKSIVDVPLEWFYSDAVVLRFRSDVELNEISLQEIKDELRKIKYQLKPLDIVLLQTDGDLLWEKKEYFTSFRGVSLEATEWLVSQGIKVIGVDTFGFDPPFRKMLDRYNDTNDKATLWPAHIFGRKKEYCQIERLANLRDIPVQVGFKVICFPIKIFGCGAGWSRVVALFKN